MTDARRGARRIARTGRTLRAACVLALVGVLACAGCTAASPAAAPASPASIVPPASPAPPASTPEAAAAAPAAPAPPAPSRVVIPALSLDEELIDLGIAADGSMEVPADYDEVGWFTSGGRPGGTGPTVIAAHVDSPTGPAVFVDLENVVVGDVIEVYDDDGGTAHAYRVTETADYPKSAFPTARVFGATAKDELRLITCGGVFDRDAGSYVDNRVVYAERA